MSQVAHGFIDQSDISLYTCIRATSSEGQAISRIGRFQNAAMKRPAYVKAFSHKASAVECVMTVRLIIITSLAIAGRTWLLPASYRKPCPVHGHGQDSFAHPANRNFLILYIFSDTGFQSTDCNPGTSLEPPEPPRAAQHSDLPILYICTGRAMNFSRASQNDEVQCLQHADMYVRL